MRRARASSVVATALLGFVCAAPNAMAGAPDHLAVADQVRLLDCEPAAAMPCFRMKLNIVDANGDPAPAELAAPGQLTNNTSVLLEGQRLTPFYVEAQNATSMVRGRTALVLVDISGSMRSSIGPNETRFDAAKSALKEFLSQFQDGVDEVAIVPFESHNVAATIRAAQFSKTKGDALSQVDQLPAPGPHNNTGLYSAVDTGLDVLADHEKTSGAAAGDREVMLVVMTDGKNEVYKGDDADLLDGPDALRSVAQKVRTTPVDVIGIGFGNPAEIDKGALNGLSKQVYMAPDADTLRRSFTMARTLLNSRILVTFNSNVWTERARLASHTLRMRANMKLASGQTIVSPEILWAAPAMGMPVFDGKCSDQEREALFRIITTPDQFHWMTLLRPVLVFLAISALLLLLWFGLPRLIWPDRYSGLEEDLQRWQAPGRGSGRHAPVGFTSSGKQGAFKTRTPGDATMVPPQTGIGKTRLG